MTTKQPTEPKRIDWDREWEEAQEVREWAANERRLIMAQRGAPYTEPYDCGTGL